jgi:hypothetical protein
MRNEIYPGLLELVWACRSCEFNRVPVTSLPCSRCTEGSKYEPNESVLAINDLLMERDALEDELTEAKSELGEWRVNFVENNRNRKWKP